MAGFASPPGGGDLQMRAVASASGTDPTMQLPDVSGRLFVRTAITTDQSVTLADAAFLRINGSTTTNYDTILADGSNISGDSKIQLGQFSTDGDARTCDFWLTPDSAGAVGVKTVAVTDRNGIKSLQVGRAPATIPLTSVEIYGGSGPATVDMEAYVYD